MAACGMQSTASTESGADDQVAVVAESLSSSALASTVVKEVSLSQLQADYPGEVAASVDPGALRADAIVGWYDKGSNYHEQKMEKNLKPDFGSIVIDPIAIRGIAVQH